MHAPATAPTFPSFPSEWTAPCCVVLGGSAGALGSGESIAEKLESLNKRIQDSLAILRTPIAQYHCLLCDTRWWLQVAPTPLAPLPESIAATGVLGGGSPLCPTCAVERPTALTIPRLLPPEEWTGYGLYACAHCRWTWASEFEFYLPAAPQNVRCRRTQPFQCRSHSVVIVKMATAQMRHAYLEYNFLRRHICRLTPRSMIQSPPPLSPQHIGATPLEPQHEAASEASDGGDRPAEAEPDQEECQITVATVQGPVRSGKPRAPKSSNGKDRMCSHCHRVAHYTNPMAHRCQLCGHRVFLNISF